MDILNESVKNLIGKNSDKEKLNYLDQVWDILQESYKSQGGIKGNGFQTKESMLTIPFWKLDIVDGKVLCVIMYKYTPTDTIKGNVRKLCALGIVSDEDRNLARTKMRNIMKMEFSRSIMEVSGLMEGYLQKNFPVEYKKYLVPTKDVEDILVFDEIIPVDEYRYKRIIGDEFHEKIMLGTKKAAY